MTKPTTPNPWGLTARQCEVIALIVAGNSAKTAARVLGLSFHSVEKHMHLGEQMGVHSVVQAALNWDRHHRPFKDSP